MDIEINPFIRRAWYSTLHANEYFRPRVIFDYELLYIKDGHCLVQVEDNIYQAQRGDIFLFRPNRQHSLKIASDTDLIQPHVHFDVEQYADAEKVPVNYVTFDNVPAEQRSMFRRDVLEEELGPLPDFIHPSDYRIFEKMILEVIYTNERKDSILDQIICKQTFLQLLHQTLYEMQLSSNNNTIAKENTAARIRTYIDHNLDRSIKLNEIAAKCYVSKCYMIDVFKEVYGITPHQYHKKQRIEKSQHLLRFTNMSVTEVAIAMGFDSIHPFTNKFHEIVGMSPSEYRKRFMSIPEDTLNTVQFNNH